MENPARAHMLVSGQVQGVFFRENTRKKAEELGVYGWVRNMLDGRVEIVAEGGKEKLQQLADWAKQGPDLCMVVDFKINWKDYKGEFQEFQVKY